MMHYNPHISKEDPLYKFHFEEYHSDSNIKLHLGYNPLITLSKRLGEYHILLDLEQPNSFLHPETNKNTSICEEFFDKILTINPIFVKNKNELLGRNLYEHVFFPYSHRYILNSFDKTNDIIYTGNKDYFDVCKNLSKNHEIIWVGADGNQGRVSYEKKINLISSSKISISHSIIDFTDITDYINSHENIIHNVNGIIEQHKARTIEAAFNKSIILHIKTGQNIIEEFFEEGVDFLYYEEGLVDEILNNYEKYTYLSENAFNKALTNYTSEHFYKNFIKQNK